MVLPCDALCGDDVSNFVGDNQNSSAGNAAVVEQGNGPLQCWRQLTSWRRDDARIECRNHCSDCIGIVSERRNGMRIASEYHQRGHTFLSEVQQVD